MFGFSKKKNSSVAISINSDDLNEVRFDEIRNKIKTLGLTGRIPVFGLSLHENMEIHTAIQNGTLFNVIVVKSDDVEDSTLDSIEKELKNYLPMTNMVVLGLSPDESFNFLTIEDN
jgi:hypothetical protein